MMEPKLSQQPPPLPPKTKKAIEILDGENYEGGNIKSEYGVVGKITKNIGNVVEVIKSSSENRQATSKTETTKQSPQKEESRGNIVKKSFSLNSRKGNGIVGKIASAFSEPSKRSDNGFKIITWADKSFESGKMKKVDEEFLYQNVSNSGTNYIEYKLKDIISSKDIQNSRKTTIKSQEDKNGINKVSNKATASNDRVKTDSATSQTWMAAQTRQIQVKQVKNKTVVKISMNDCPDTPTQNKDNYFKPLNDDDFSTSEYQYPELLFQKNKTVSSKVNEYAEPFRGHTVNSVQLYANVDLSKKRKNQNDGQIYENTDVVEDESKDGLVYMNVGNGEVYANIDGNTALPVTEHHYLNINSTINGTTVPRPAPDDSDQVYENEDFTVLKNSQVTQSIIQKNPLPTKQEVYENTDFITKNNVLDDIQFSGPGIKENSGYQTPRSALRLVVNEVDPEMMKTKNKYVIQNFIPQDSAIGDGQYSPSDTFDSGTGSDQENSSPIILSSPINDGKLVVTVNVNNEQEDRSHKRAESITSSGVGVDSEVSDTEESNISCDSLNSNDLQTFSVSEDHGYHTPTSENKTNSPIEGMEYQIIDVKSPLPEQTVEDEQKYANNITFKIHDSSDVESTDIIQQVANAAERLKNLRIENTGMYLARRIESCDDVYENCDFYETSDKTSDHITLTSDALSQTLQTDNDSIDGFKTLPKGLLRDIRSRSVRALSAYPNGEKSENQSILPKIVKIQKSNIIVKPKSERHQEEKKVVINEKTYEERKTETSRICGMELDTDKFYKFHLYEKFDATIPEKATGDDESFAGFRDYLNRERPAAITSAKGTIRGVKNRVKAGIATFLQLQENKMYKDKDAGKIVIYSTTMGIVRETYQKCLKVKQILKTLMVKFEERDVFMSSEAQEEIRERMKCDAILVPQVFVEGQHIGDAETIDKLNETGELRKILKSYKSIDAGATCNVCGGYRLLPCRVCKGSKKSVHRNHFTAEFVSLKCMNCDPVGLMKCYAC